MNGQPFLFGPRERPLFGLKHEALSAAQPTGIVLCPAWGAEAMRAYRGLRALAIALAGRGFETLRFDYAGTGDSSGDGMDAHLDHWLADIGHAAKELRESAGCTRIALLGHRSGALLAAEALRRGTAKAEALIAWDAPENGAAFVSLMQAHDLANDARKLRYRSAASRLEPRAPNDLRGHAWPAELAAGFSILPGSTHSKLLWVHSSDHAVPPPTGATLLPLAEAAHWELEAWQDTPYAPVTAMQGLAEKISTWL